MISFLDSLGLCDTKKAKGAIQTTAGDTVGGHSWWYRCVFSPCFQEDIYHHSYILSLKKKILSLYNSFSRNFQILIVLPLYLCLCHKLGKSGPLRKQSWFLARPSLSIATDCSVLWENDPLSVVCWTPAIFTEGALTSVRLWCCTIPAGVAAKIRAETYSDSFLSQMISCVCGCWLEMWILSGPANSLWKHSHNVWLHRPVLARGQDPGPVARGAVNTLTEIWSLSATFHPLSLHPHEPGRLHESLFVLRIHFLCSRISYQPPQP